MAYRYLLLAATLFFTAPADAATAVHDTITTATWTKTDGPYVVTDTIIVPAGNTLTIGPGVDVLFDANVPFIVEGSMHVHGSEQDSVRFLNGAVPHWLGIRIISADSSSFSYSRISGGDVRGKYLNGCGGGMYVSGSIDPARLNLAHTVISGNSSTIAGGGLLVRFSKATLAHCSIIRNTSNFGGGVCIAEKSNAGLTDCIIGENLVTIDGGGLYISDSSEANLDNCIIRENLASFDGGGLSIWDAVVNLRRCAVTENTTTSTSTSYVTCGGIRVGDSSAVSLTHCTISRNSAFPASGVGGLYADNERAILVRSSVVWGNVGRAEWFFYDHEKNKAWDTPFSDLPSGLLRPLGEGVISADPLFVDPEHGDYRLRPESPCIDAGDPASPFDPDGSRADMGAFPYAHPTAVREDRELSPFSLHQNAPNPANPATSIRFSLSRDGPVSLTIYDLQGRHVRTLLENASPSGSYEVIWDGADDLGRSVASGVYLYRLVSREGIGTKRLVVAR